MARLYAGRAAGPLPTLAPPLSMEVAGQHRRLVVCVVSELAPGSGHAVWISGGNGSILQSFSYGASQEDGGTICTVSLLPDDLPAEGDLACHVGPTTTSPAQSSSPIPITGMASLTPPLFALVLLPSTMVPSEDGGSGSRCEAPQAGVAASAETHRKGFAVGPASHLVPPQLLSHPTGNDEVAELCPSNMAVPLLHASTALLVAVRVVLLKVALSSALFTSVLLAQS
ncbi:pre T-cell antigen receptor alpha isoform X2 [Melopsittacus undulatus]|uniref:pre T-cell antigen receptor alpha isoform X2 n=1 Tax=Melopsittacus undulatus TaxID=13146 RepID=UPI00146C3CF3|nr:pre T-cell antigen receptor alpha isoform X2 [Melopsittacus undulatus]